MACVMSLTHFLASRSPFPSFPLNPAPFLTHPSIQPFSNSFLFALQQLSVLKGLVSEAPSGDITTATG